MAVRLLLVVYTDLIEYIVSPNRYDIYEDLGPLLPTEVTLPAFFLVFAWPVAIGAVSLFYCGEYFTLPPLLVPQLSILSHGHLRVL